MHHLTCKLKFVRSASTGLKQNSEKERNEKKKNYLSVMYGLLRMCLCVRVFLCMT